MQAQGTYRGFRTAGIRLLEEPSPLIPRPPVEDGLLEHFHNFDKAQVVMLTEEGLILRADGVAMLRALRSMEAEGVVAARHRVGGGMHSGEQYLIRSLGEQVGGRMHMGRSSGDLGSVAWRLRSRAGLLAAMASLNRLRETMLDLAGQYLDAAMPTYTHGKHAQITTFGAVLVSWAGALERDGQRLREAYDHINVSTAGCAAGTGTSFPLNRRRTAELLGYDVVSRNARDQYSPDPFFQQLAALALLNTSLQEWANDLMFWGSDEMGMIDLADRFCGTSSIMAQKKNMVALEAFKALASRAVMALNEAIFDFKGPTMLPVHERAFASFGLWRGLDDAVAVLNLFREALLGLEVNADRMADQAGRYWAQATDLAGALVKEKDLPWRTAHQIIGIVVRLSYERGLTPQDCTPALIDEAAMLYMGQPVGLSHQALAETLDPRNFPRGRTLLGGPAPEETARRIPGYRSRLEADAAWLDQANARVQRGRETLDGAIDTLLGGTTG